MMLKKRWSEARLDDLNQKVDDGFNKVDGQFSRLDRKIDRLTYCLLAAAIGYIATHGL